VPHASVLTLRAEPERRARNTHATRSNETGRTAQGEVGSQEAAAEHCDEMSFRVVKLPQPGQREAAPDFHSVRRPDLVLRA
jgi:hypothetical protein